MGTVAEGERERDEGREHDNTQKQKTRREGRARRRLYTSSPLGSPVLLTLPWSELEPAPSFR
jgi:hypothetical protein